MTEYKDQKGTKNPIVNVHNSLHIYKSNEGGDNFV